ncbi:hypothetical protein ACFX2G_004292 [Malus domestica]
MESSDLLSTINVSARASAYVSQHDWHAVEMTIRETLKFAGRCQGVGFKYGKLYIVKSLGMNRACFSSKSPHFSPSSCLCLLLVVSGTTASRGFQLLH